MCVDGKQMAEYGFAMEKIRMVRVDDLTADALEREAKRMPPSHKDQADILRDKAQNLRTNGSSNMVPVLEEAKE
jgi:hypothetical protein